MAACGRLPRGAALPVELDVRDAVAVEDLAASALAHFGRVDLVCNNAGVI